jgi:glycerophosphoryl diester phosphodiesterase
VTRFLAGRPIVVAHRGGALEAAENTVAAFERAIRLGYPGVEFDVRRSSDGIPVVVHDAEVAAGGVRRAVADLSAAESGLPSLDLVLALPFGDTVLMVEVKPGAHDRVLGAEVARAIAASGRAGRAVIASFSPEVLSGAAVAAPLLARMGLLDDPDGAAAFRGLDLFAWGVDLALVTRGRVEGWRGSGLEVWTWTIKDPADFERAQAAGVDGYITDIPGTVLRLV